MVGHASDVRLRLVLSLGAIVAGLLSTSSARADSWSSGTNLIYDSNSAVKVGVRTSSPKNTLDVKGAAAIGSGFGGANTAPADGLIVQGNVGVGTTSTHNRLDVKGAAAIGSTFGGTNTAPPDGLIVQGAVGIGTTMINTGMALQVNGSTFVSGSVQANGGFKVNSWSIEAPDYVFDQSRFKLMSLEDVERFVKANRHLPEIPSAGELEKNGMDLAEMNLRLLKKVEELTLYVIEQKKEIHALATTVQDLRSNVSPSKRPVESGR